MNNLVSDLHILLASGSVLCALQGERITGNGFTEITPNRVIDICVNDVRASMVLRIDPSTRGHKLLIFRPLPDPGRPTAQEPASTIRIVGAAIRHIKGGYAVSAPIVADAAHAKTLARAPHRSICVPCATLCQALSLALRAVNARDLPAVHKTLASGSIATYSDKGGQS